MELRPFLLDEWLTRFHFARPPIPFDLASSTGPPWTLRELLGEAGEKEREAFLDTQLLYTDSPGGESLRVALGRMLDVPPEEVLVVTGASEALLALFWLAAEPGANVVIPSPGYPPIPELPRSLGLDTRAYRLRRENGFRIDVDEVKRLTDARTKLVVVNSPHNPTGTAVDPDELKALHDFTVERGVTLVVDEVYHPIYHDRDRRSATALPHATVLGDFSKALCLSGLRLGWIVERDRERRAQVLNARSYFTISNTAPGEALAEIAVRRRDVIYARARKAASENLGLLERFMAEHETSLGWVRPGGGMTAFPWLRGAADARPFCERAAEHGVLLAPGDCFGYPDHFRLGFGTSGARFGEALERLGALVASGVAAA